MPIRHTIVGRTVPRGATPRRVAAAKRALKKEREQHALFVDQFEQESPHERIEHFDERLLRQEQGCRDLAAKHWRWGRHQILSLEASVRDELMALWNKKTEKWLPAHAHYFADFIRTQLRDRGLPLAEDA